MAHKRSKKKEYPKNNKDKAKVTTFMLSDFSIINDFEKSLKTNNDDISTKVLAALSNAVITCSKYNENLSYDPNKDYLISKKTKMEKLPTDYNQDVKHIQRTPIFLEQEVADNLLNCKKFVYKIEVQKKKGIKQVKLFLIGKINDKYVPSMVIFSLDGSYVKSVFASRLKNINHIVLHRIDPQGQHENFLYIANMKGFIKKQYDQQLKPNLPHKHLYSVNAFKYVLFKGNVTNKNVKNKDLQRLEAQQIDTPIQSFKDILTLNIQDLNMHCVKDFIPKDKETIEEFFDRCLLQDSTKTKETIENCVKSNKQEPTKKSKTKPSNLETNL